MKKPAQPIQLVIMNTRRPESEIVGLKAVPDRLEQVMRLPGESFQAMSHRAMWMATGSGPLLAYPLFRD